MYTHFITLTLTIQTRHEHKWNIINQKLKFKGKDTDGMSGKIKQGGKGKTGSNIDLNKLYGEIIIIMIKIISTIWSSRNEPWSQF